MRASLRFPALSALIALATTLAPLPARAMDAGEVAGEPVSVDVTNTAIGAYHFDNRNTQALNPRTHVDDNYGELLDRFNVLVGWWRFRLGVRLDTASYFATPDSDKARQLAADDQTAAGQPVTNEYANRYYRELNTRYLNTVYPSKLFVDYTMPGLTVTVGDFYAQLGRGLVFSVRKIDELAIDTTVRGAKVQVDHDFNGFQVAAQAFAGQMNPLRVDEQTGRRLNGSGSPLFFGFPEARRFNYVVSDPTTNQAVDAYDLPRPSYLEDTVVGGHVEAGPQFIKFGVNGSMLMRKSYTEQYLLCTQQCAAGDAQCQSDCGSQYPDFSSNNASRNHNLIRTFSGSVSLPSIAKVADAYVEVAGQQLRDGHVLEIDSAGSATKREDDISGWAVYANANVHVGPATLSLEGKRYEKFFPLSANVDISTPGFSAPEYDILSYNSVPTVEPIYVEQIGQPNICMSGGRGRADVRLSKDLLVYAWLGRYTSWSEIDPTNASCDKRPELQTNTWDSAVGSEILFDHGQSHVFSWIGGRLTDRAVASDANAAGLTDTFYREGYIRYDIVKHIAGPFSLQLQGFHRHRYQPQEFSEPWNEGENYTALQWSPHFAAIFGYEYLGKRGCAPADPGQPDVMLCHYFNGGLQWRSADNATVLKQLFDTVSLFVGQRRGAIRCVSGVCRQFPPFEGARLEVVSRF